MNSYPSVMPCVSVIIPVYNSAHFIGAAIDSVNAQTFQDFEILVVDDGSTDDLIGALEVYKGSIQVMHQENAGPSSARNRGINAARGEFIAFLDADDLWAPEKLELQVKCLNENPDSAACFTECVYFNENGTTNADLWRRVPTSDKMFEALLTERFVHMSSLMVRRQALNEVGVFDEGLIGCEDYNLYLRIARYFSFQFLPQPLFQSRSHSGKLSNNLAQMSHDEIVNFNKIDAMFPELKLPRGRVLAQIWFRFGQYYFDAGDFEAARECFAKAIKSSYRKSWAYVYWLLAAVPPGIREGVRNLIRVMRGKKPQNNEVNQESKPTKTPPINYRKTALNRVMLVTWSLVAGGSEAYAFTLAQNLDRKQFSPLMCALDQGGALEPEIKHSDIPYWVMNRRSGIQVDLMWRMFRLMRRKRVNVVHTHHFNQLFYSFIGAKLCGARLIHTEHSIENYDHPHRRRALRVLAMGCYRVVTSGEESARILHNKVGIPEDKLQIVHTGIQVDSFDITREDGRRELQLAPDVPVAATIARLSPEDDHKDLLEAWVEVVRVIPDAILIIAGDLTEELALNSEIERLALQKQVQIVEIWGNEANVLAACNVFVLCANREELPLSLLEAMAAARPVIATSVGNVPLLVREGETGTMVPPHDSAALAEALIQILCNPERGTQYGEVGRQAVQGYDIKSMIEAHQALYGAPISNSDSLPA
jgi:glycosyltransferase involved in cell wall biosynthesis